MDVLILAVAAGCAVLGGFWGVVRMVSTAGALVGGVLAGRIAGPSLAVWAFGPTASLAPKVLASLVAGGLAFFLLLLAGTGVRKLLERVHLSLLDRLLGAGLAAFLALFLSAVLLALASAGGFPARGRVSERLSSVGGAFLAAYRPSTSSAKPSNTPKKPTSNGQHPEGP
ncbi:MAG: CvpA family protein [Thermoanaerobaculum sp.]